MSDVYTSLNPWCVKLKSNIRHFSQAFVIHSIDMYISEQKLNNLPDAAVKTAATEPYPRWGRGGGAWKKHFPQFLPNLKT